MKANKSIVYPAVKLLLKITVPVRRDTTALGTCKCTSRVCHLEVLGHVLTRHIICCYLAMCMCPTLRIYNTYSRAVAYHMACTPHTVLTAYNVYVLWELQTHMYMTWPKKRDPNADMKCSCFRDAYFHTCTHDLQFYMWIKCGLFMEMGSCRLPAF